MKIYRSEQEFIKALDNLGLSPNQINEILEHEKAHLKKARELGYEADFGIRQKGDNCQSPMIVIYNFDKVLKEDLIKIISAPSDLSEGDVNQLKSLEDSV
ncbi:MAG: hypothetical protein Q8N88_05780 [Nanoarchaeota archaeon]|nr:hypothetical protein [Nanoarchaeota archaeon]